MKIPLVDADKVTARAMELLGGREAFFSAADKEQGEINLRWNQNVDMIGRILRAHLFVEHYLTEYLSKANPRLGSMATARIAFAQKLALLDASNPDIEPILPGVKRLNAIRNRLAHNLSAQVTKEDSEVFLSCGRFAALRAAKANEETLGNSPLDILEDFARHTSLVLTYEFGVVSRAIEQAIRETQILRPGS